MGKSKMKEIEERYGKDMKTLLLEKLKNRSFREVAGEFGVSHAAIGYWCLKLGIKIERRAVPKGS